jgi:hypothetical protein
MRTFTPVFRDLPEQQIFTFQKTTAFPAGCRENQRGVQSRALPAIMQPITQTSA